MLLTSSERGWSATSPQTGFNPWRTEEQAEEGKGAKGRTSCLFLSINVTFEGKEGTIKKKETLRWALKFVQVRKLRLRKVKGLLVQGHTAGQ